LLIGTILEFRFNLADAILGPFIDDSKITDPPPDAPCGLPYWDFIATRLLPCGPVDAPIEKFTGNDDVGPAPGTKECLTVALHAFTHYVAVWSHGNFLLCDLQGWHIRFFSASWWANLWYKACMTRQALYA